ncbi:MAG: acyltransferase 3, partial [Rhizorhabdus sp.]|nr:acyltransferase 3 [Rhizorhabdus sp.]
MNGQGGQHGKEANNIGFLRLMLAGAVIVSHSPGTIDGNGSREPLRMLFDNISLGDVAVDGFFMLSGYLIVQSMMTTPRLIDYLAKRVLRIYPAFILAYLL